MPCSQMCRSWHSCRYSCLLYCSYEVSAILYRRRLDTRHTAIAGLLQATSLTFIVAATQIGEQLHLITPAISAALVAAGLLSVIIYPLIALTLLRGIKVVEKINEEEPISLIEPM